MPGQRPDAAVNGHELNVCGRCAADEFLARQVRDAAVSPACDYCGTSDPNGNPIAAPVSVFLKCVARAIHNYWANPVDELSYDGREGGYRRHGRPVSNDPGAQRPQPLRPPAGSQLFRPRPFARKAQPAIPPRVRRDGFPCHGQGWPGAHRLRAHADLRRVRSSPPAAAFGRARPRDRVRELPALRRALLRVVLRQVGLRAERKAGLGRPGAVAGARREQRQAHRERGVSRPSRRRRERGKRRRGRSFVARRPVPGDTGKIMIVARRWSSSVLLGTLPRGKSLSCCSWPPRRLMPSATARESACGTW